MAWRYVLTGRLEKGEVRMRNVPKMRAALVRKRDCDVVVTIEKLHAHRSKPQNDYMWAVVVPRIQTTFRKRRIVALNDDPKLVHEFLKAHFMDPELIRTGKIRGWITPDGLTIGTSTTDLNKLEFIEYLERIVEHAATAWDTYIPPPDPNWRENLERAEEEERILEAEYCNGSSGVRLEQEGA